MARGVPASPPGVASTAGGPHRPGSTLAGDERAQALVVLPARGAALQMRGHAGDRGLGIAAGELGADELAEALQALLAADLRARPAQQACAERAPRIAG